ncbi:MAG: efflux RND transporter periplasmic adaptor subunit [Thermoanaerobaculia bacterium]|nr:efflux RND transporter periplasmic adaptor subunit [Thermoanaerobaculia bacterium]
MIRSVTWRRVLIAVLLAVPAFLQVGCGAEPETETDVVRPVRWLEVAPAPEYQERSFTGTARAGLESRLSFRVSGTVENVSVSVGDSVAERDEIARLDATDAELRVRQAEASVDQAVAAKRRAEADYERVRGLYENDNAAKADLDAARAQAESARSQLEAARQALALANRERAYTQLQAPVAGAIASVQVEAGENVQAGQAVALLTSGSHPEVEVGMPEVLIADVHEGDGVLVSFDALPDTSLPATVTEVGVAATGSTYPIKVRLDDEDPSIRSGMAATVSFHFRHAGDDTAGSQRVVLPPVAVGEDRDGRFVFVLQQAGGEELWTANRRAVTVGQLTPEGLEITGGLEHGERVATAGLRRIREGQTVRLLAP